MSKRKEKKGSKGRKKEDETVAIGGKKTRVEVKEDCGEYRKNRRNESRETKKVSKIEKGCCWGIEENKLGKQGWGK